MYCLYCPGGFVHFFTVTEWGPTIRFRRQTGETPVSVLSRETWNRLAFFWCENCRLAENSVTILVDRRRRVRLRVLVVLRDIFLGVLQEARDFSYAMCDFCI